MNINDKKINSQSSKYSIYSRPAYFKELTEQIAKTKKNDRVLLSTMAFEPSDPLVREVLKELLSASKRGVSVELIVDAYPFIINEQVRPGPLFYRDALSDRMPAAYRQKFQVLEKLKEAGARFSIINLPGRALTNPFAGRLHIKIAIINDAIFIGGCNLSGGDHIDLMIGWEEGAVATRLHKLMMEIADVGNVRMVMNDKDLSFALDSKNELLVDCGKPSQSLILDKALDLIDAADEFVFMTCQFFPNAMTIRHLAKARARGVQVTIAYNHPSKHPWPMSILHYGVKAVEQTRLPKSFFANELPKSQPYLHAKLIATENGAIMGSHNFVASGVKFGTAEMSILSSDRAFASSLVLTLKQQLH